MPIHQKVRLSHKQADGYIIPLGTLNLVTLVTDKGMVGCGAFDVMALDKYNYPAARIMSATGDPIATTDDLVAGFVKDANAAATNLGIKPGMPGKEALNKM